MVKCVKDCLNVERTEDILVEPYTDMLAEKLGKMVAPPNLPSFDSIKKMTDAERLKTLEPIIKPIISDMLSRSGYRVGKHIKTVFYL